jgi:hypothetical protein
MADPKQPNERPDPLHPDPQVEDRPNPGIVEVPDEDVPEVDLPEGPIPGMPPASDPLLNPMPRPTPREIKPLD